MFLLVNVEKFRYVCYRVCVRVCCICLFCKMVTSKFLVFIKNLTKCFESKQIEHNT